MFELQRTKYTIRSSTCQDKACPAKRDCLEMLRKVTYTHRLPPKKECFREDEQRRRRPLQPCLLWAALVRPAGMGRDDCTSMADVFAPPHMICRIGQENPSTHSEATCGLITLQDMQSSKQAVSNASTAARQTATTAESNVVEEKNDFLTCTLRRLAEACQCPGLGT